MGLCDVRVPIYLDEQRFKMYSPLLPGRERRERIGHNYYSCMHFHVSIKI
jgi:hypothetical protein